MAVVNASRLDCKLRTISYLRDYDVRKEKVEGVVAP